MILQVLPEFGNLPAVITTLREIPCAVPKLIHGEQSMIIV